MSIGMNIDQPSVLVGGDDVRKPASDIGAGREVMTWYASWSGRGRNRHDVTVGVFELVRAELTAPIVYFNLA